MILFSTLQGVFRVSSAGGSPVKVSEEGGVMDHAWLTAERFLFGTQLTNGIYAGSLNGANLPCC